MPRSSSRLGSSRFGISPHDQSSFPPYDLGMLDGSMKEVRVGSTSAAERMKIFEVVPGSNQRLIQPQTVGKNEGAPII